MDYCKIGEKVRKFRKAKGMSQEQLAEIVDISVTHISHIETGNTKLILSVFLDIAKALGYEDQNYFSRRFRMSVGCSPSQHRKRRENIE